MRHLLTIALIGLLLRQGLCQSPIDSLRHVVTQAETDTGKVIAMGHLIYELSYGNKEEAQQLVNEAMILAIKSNYSKGIAKMNDLQGIIHLDKGDLDSAQIYFLKALEYYQKFNKKENIFNSYQKLGQLHSNRNSFDRAYEYYSKSAEIAEELGDYKLMGNAQNGLGTFYIGKGWNKLDNENDTINYTSYFDQGVPYILKAIEYFEKAEYTKGVALAYANLGILEKEMNHPRLSMHYMMSAVKYFEKMDFKIYQVTAYNHMAKIYRNLEIYDSALIMTQKSLELSKDIDSKFDIRNAYGEFANIYQTMGKYKSALENHQLYDDVNAQILDENKQRQIEEYELKYQSERSERELSIQLARNEQQRLIIAIIVIIAMSLIILISILWRKNIRERHFKKILMTQKEELVSLNEEISSQRDQLSNSNTLLQEANIEQENIMAIVAHDLRSPLNKVKGLMEVMGLSNEMTEDVKDLNNKTSQVAADGLVLISDIMKFKEYENNLEINVEEVSLNEMLSKAISNHQSYATRKSINISLIDSKDVKLKIDKIHLSRIMDNLLSNAIKFSNLNKDVEISYAQTDYGVEILVKDQGPGMTEEDLKNVFKQFKKLSARPTAGENSSGLGLSIVKTLVEKLNGEISIDTKIGEGSTFKLHFPS